MKPVGAVSALVLLILVLVAVFAPLISPYDPLYQNYGVALQGPTMRHPLGNDPLGRDVLSRILFGARISLWVATIAVGIGTLLGVVIGLTSGYWEGLVDLFLQRIVDILMAIPGLLLALTIVATLGSSITNVMLAISVGFAPGASRIVRGVTLALKRQQFVEAAHAIGCGNVRILLWHILPNALAPIIIIASVGLGGAILIEASLSFLGLGTPPPTPSWGGMLSTDGRQYMTHAPWLAVFPGLAITLVVLAFNLFGDALRDILDPRLRGTR